MYKQFRTPTCLAPFSLLVAFALQMQGSGLAITAARAEEASESFYPGRYVANCKPAPIVGCVCETDSPGPISKFPQITIQADDHDHHIRDIEYLRMIEWLRQTCNAVTESGRLR